ncbi:MAG TPA: TlpA disulfide reductase family protein [Bacteroidales bacterium]|nr:TlpA disulfide reductase family protein [Bacteroidales bacterium]HPS15653.1 TlpA disulfide reductase family protein [Bacteroidales bacterium]
MKKNILIILIFLISSSIQAQQVNLKGIVKNVESKTIDVFKYTDMLSYSLEKIASGKIDTSGKFNFSFKIEETIFTYIKIGTSQAPLYIEPNKTYNLKISCNDCNSINDKTNPYLDPKILEVIIENSDSTELNNMVSKFNNDYDAFIYKNYITLIKQRNKAKIDSFRVQVNKKYSIDKNSYFDALVRYRFAAIEQMAQLKSNLTFAKKYFLDQPVLYENTGYMEFFNNFFESYIISVSPNIKAGDLNKTINVLGSFPAFLDSLGKDTILKNEVLREMVAIKSLVKLFYSNQYSPESIIHMLQYLADNTKFPKHKIASENIITLLTKLIKGSVAPAFSLKDMNGQSYTLAELNKDKYVYLIFWNTWCVPCISDMELIDGLIKKYGTKITFIGISCDKEFMTFYHFMQQNKKFNFTCLYWGNDTKLLDDYNIKAFPTYFLIDPEGKIYQNPAEAPSQYLDGLLKLITKEKK